MSEKFVVGKWVTSQYRIGVYRVAKIDTDGTLQVEGSDAWHPEASWEPFAWQVGKRYKTKIDGVTATIKSVDEVGYINAVTTYNPNYCFWRDGTGKLCGFEDRDDVPHLLPYLADEPPPLADAAPFSAFEEADECDDVNHPTHYTQHPSGVECIAIAEAFNFNVGNAIKYLWRAGLKGDSLEDLRKAAWYVQREIERRERSGQ